MIVTPNGEEKIKGKVTRRGIVKVAPELILRWLQFQGGTIQAIRLLEEDNVEFLIKHPDMPDHQHGFAVTEVCPEYTIEYPSNKITRISPKRTK